MQEIADNNKWGWTEPYLDSDTSRFSVISESKLFTQRNAHRRFVVSIHPSLETILRSIETSWQPRGSVIIIRTDRLGDRLSCMQIFMFLFCGFWELSVGRGVADSVCMIWGLKKAIQRTDSKPWKFEGKIFRLHEDGPTSLVKFFVDTHGTSRKFRYASQVSVVIDF